MRAKGSHSYSDVSGRQQVFRYNERMCERKVSCVDVVLLEWMKVEDLMLWEIDCMRVEVLWFRI